MSCGSLAAIDEITYRRPQYGATSPCWANPAALLRLAGSVLIEAHDEWQVADERYLSESTLALLNEPYAHPEPNVAAPAALTA